MNYLKAVQSDPLGSWTNLAGESASFYRKGNEMAKADVDVKELVREYREQELEKERAKAQNRANMQVSEG